MKYLITGASGHLGQKVVAHLRKYVDETEVRVGIHNMKKASLFENTGLEISHLDYCDSSTIDQSFLDVEV